MCHYSNVRQGVRKVRIFREEEDEFCFYPKGRVQCDHRRNRWGRRADTVDFQGYSVDLENSERTQSKLVLKFL